MSKLEEKIENFEYYKKEFATWIPKEVIIDDKKAFWELRKPDSEYRKVCLFRDGHNMYVYGDYGSFTFDSMTWLGSPYNLEYDNFGYQMEKLDRESRQSLRVFDEYACEEDIKDWIEWYLEDKYENNEGLANDIFKYVKSNYMLMNYEIEEYCEENDLEEFEDLIIFVKDCLNHVDEYEWISFLRNSNLEDFEDPCESLLWNAGIRTHQRYYVNMYALKVLGEKLNERK